MRRAPLALALVLALSACASTGDEAVEGPLVDELLRAHPGRFGPLLANAEAHRLQVLVAEVREGPAGPKLVRHGFRVDAEYFYPASSIKTFAAASALRLVAERDGLELDTPLVYHPLFADEVREDTDASNLAGGTITVGHEVRKLSIVSDNRAFNRLYELVGHEELNRDAWAAGFDSVRIQHRLSEFRSVDDQLRTPRIDFGEHTAPPRTSPLRLENEGLAGLEIGVAHVASGERIGSPMSFARKNRVSLADLQDMLIAIVRPDLELGGKRIELSEEHRAFLVEAMAQYPRESRNPVYTDVPDAALKFLLPGLARVVPAERLRIANKVGRAYGFSVENAYVQDRTTGRAFFVTATLYTNPNETLNDDNYGYASTADPFFADLGEVLARHLLGEDESAYDVLIRGGTVIDGTGTAGRRADVAIRGDTVARIGDLGEARATRVIDATGKLVTPGFIDTHAHGDPRATPAFENFLAMGVTTICLGQDGRSPQDRSSPASGLGPNLAWFIGHASVRERAGVPAGTPADAEQRARMAGLVEEALAGGCFGLTTGLEYAGGAAADLDELIAIAEPVGRAGGLVMSHLRSEDDERIDAALDELIAQGRGARCAVHVSHIKVVLGQGAGRAEELLARMDAARAAGLSITADLYPYEASYTGIGILFPPWAKVPHDYERVALERRDELAAHLRARVASRKGPAATLLGTEPWTGRTLAEVAQERGEPFEDFLIALGPRGASAAYFVMDLDLQERLLLAPHTMVCSDGSPTMHHPRGYGAFAKVIRFYAHERGSLSIEQAVHKMTGLPARTLGLDEQRRGLLREGWAADVLVIDPTGIRDRATFVDPHALAQGFDCVLVNGAFAREGARAGRVLDSTVRPAPADGSR
ncbi:MAG: amidohydrolase family protein [bacterium]|nr:amidohydrolase family protein [bacterium]